MNPQIYRQLFKPRHAMLCDYVQSDNSMHTFIYSCGSISLLRPDMIDAGIEILPGNIVAMYDAVKEFDKK